MRKSNRLQELRFSPEFEFNTPMSRTSLEDLFNTNQLLWDVKFDGSLNDGLEVCPSLSNHLKGKQGLLECERVLTLLKEEAEATQSSKTGFHIHWNLLDADGVGIMTPKQLTNIFIDWYNFKRVIELVLPESRRGDNVTNLRGVSKYHIQDMINIATRLGKDDKAKLRDFMSEARTGHLVDLGINSDYGTLEFRKAIFTVDTKKLLLWIEFTRNFIGFNMKARQKKFRTFMDSPENRLSLNHDKGLAWSFRSVFEYRAGNLGLLDLAERRACQLASRSFSTREEIRGITQKIKTKYNRA